MGMTVRAVVKVPFVLNNLRARKKPVPTAFVVAAAPLGKCIGIAAVMRSLRDGLSHAKFETPRCEGLWGGTPAHRESRWWRFEVRKGYVSKGCQGYRCNRNAVLKS